MFRVEEMMTYHTSSSYLCQKHILYMETIGLPLAVCIPPPSPIIELHKTDTKVYV